jgi:hypothetical protein
LRIAEWPALAPAAVVQPGPRIDSALGRQAEQITDRALRPDRGRMMAPDRRERAIGARQAEDRDLQRILHRQCHVHGVFLAPQPKQGAAAIRRQDRRRFPSFRIHLGARPGAMRFDTPACV